MTEPPRSTVNVAVKPQVGIGLSTIAGGSVTAAAYIAAIAAFIGGARDEVTLSTLAVGTVALVSTIAVRGAQAVAAIRHAGFAQTVANVEAALPLPEPEDLALDPDLDDLDDPGPDPDFGVAEVKTHARLKDEVDEAGQ